MLFSTSNATSVQNFIFMQICSRCFPYSLRLIGMKYITRIRLGLSHLRYHKFKHRFLDAIDPLCSCSTGIENTVHYFLHCPNFSTARNTFLNEIAIVDRPIINQDEIKSIQTFLYGKPNYSVNDNKLILDASIKYILEIKRLEGPIF